MGDPGPIPVPRWRPADLPSLRAAYSDRTAALMAYLAAFAYDARIEATSAIEVPKELAGFGFRQFTAFHNGLCDGFAYIAEGKDLIVLSFRGTQSSVNWRTNLNARLIHPHATDRNLKVHEGFYSAFVMLNDGAQGILDKMRQLKIRTNALIPIYITGHSWAARWRRLPQRYWAMIRSPPAIHSDRRGSATSILICGSNRRAIG
jgi:triacylglycerol lipase